jgi:hypothetical protein
VVLYGVGWALAVPALSYLLSWLHASQIAGYAILTLAVMSAAIVLAFVPSATARPGACP